MTTQAGYVYADYVDHSAEMGGKSKKEIRKEQKKERKEQKKEKKAQRKSYAKPKKKIIALVLLLLAGNFGIHRFYAGKIFSGILCLLTGGFFGIGLLIDGVLILFGKFKDKNGNPLQ